MSTDQHPSNGATPSWWPPPDAPDPAEGVVVSMPPRTAGIGPSAVVPPTSPPPAPAPIAVEPSKDANADGWAEQPPTTDVVVSGDVPGRPSRDHVRRARNAVQSRRRVLTVAGVTILVFVGLNMWATRLAKSVGDGVSEPLTAHNEELTNMVASIASSKSAPSQVSVQQPLAWLNCPVGSDAATMIGWDPNTQYATLDPQRAADVETQVRALIVQNPLSSLRITSGGNKTRLTVTVGGVQGTPLVDCSGAANNHQDGDRATTPTTAKQG